MIDASLVFVLLGLYMATLFAFAWRAEHSASRPDSRLANHPLIYSLGLSVYYTSWTFFGSVGSAASNGMSFLTMYLGSVLPIVFWWNVMRRMVRLKNSFRLTSIADLISARHNRSTLLAGYLTLLLLIGVVPYLALQLKSVESTFQLITMEQSSAISAFIHRHVGLLVAVLMIFFTNALGVRRLDPTERHPGMVAAVAAEGVFKLAAFLAVGLFVVFGLFDGLGDIFVHALELPDATRLGSPPAGISSLSLWFSYLLISTFAVMFLPRQFHMTVIENSDEKHIRTAMWFLPLYGFLITFLCFPVALGGRLQGLSASQADTYVLQLPLNEGVTWLGMVAFFGGYAAATGMIMICAVTMATMITNHVLVPAADTFRILRPLRRRVLQCRWAAVALTILGGYWFQQAVGESTMLLSMGVISFVGVAQIAPAMLGGLYWRRGNATGAFMGLSSGFAIWAYTLILPTLARSGWLPMELVERGPWGLAVLRPEQLFGLDLLAPVANAVFWSLAANVTAYITGSLVAPSRAAERRIADEFVDILEDRPARLPDHHGELRVPLAAKAAAVEHALNRYLPRRWSDKVVKGVIRELGLENRSHISLLELAELSNRAERILGGSIGVASAHAAFKRAQILSETEEEKLSEAYARVLARLRITPEELERRVDYYVEREKLLSENATKLEQKVQELDTEIAHRRTIEGELRQAEEKYRGIFENAVEGMFQSTPEGRFLAANRSLATMLGYADSSELITTVADITTQLYVDPSRRQELMREMESMGQVRDFTTQILHRDGSKLWCAIHARPVHGADGALELIEGTIQNITARRAAEEEVRRLYEELELRVAERTSELASINQELEAFAYSISHDLRAPLRAIDGYSEILLEDYGPVLDIEGKRYLSRVRHSSQRMGRLIEHVLQISRLTRLEVSRSPVDLSELAQRVMDELLLSEAKAPVELRIAEGLQAHTDPVLARVVLENLFGNALKFSRDADPALIEFGLSRDKGAAVFFVRDNGAGFDMDHAAKLFGIFERLHRADEFSGDGIGLATVQRVVNRLGGRIWGEGEVGSGACFFFTLE